jgi:hypothetical protein
MGMLEQMEERLGLLRDQWNLEQWRVAAESFALKIDGSPPKPRGRPKFDLQQRYGSMTTNYQALAWQVKCRRDEAREAGKKPIIKHLVRDEMHKAWVQRQHDGAEMRDIEPVRQGLIDVKLPTAYTEVRKLLKTWDAEINSPRKTPR